MKHNNNKEIKTIKQINAQANNNKNKTKKFLKNKSAKSIVYF